MDVCITADETNFLNPKIGFFIPGFIPSISGDVFPFYIRKILEKIMFFSIPTIQKDGKSSNEVISAPLGLRKLEAILLKAGISTRIISPQRTGDIDEDVKVFALSSMDPLGLGPVTVTFKGLLQNQYISQNPKKKSLQSYTVQKFNALLKKIQEFEKPIVVGGPGANQFELDPTARERLGIDYIFIGEAEEIGPKVFRKILEGKEIPKIIRARPLQNPLKQVPVTKKPTNHGLIEISRGCDRHCKFCDPSIRKFHWFSISKILKEAKINAKYNNGAIRLLSEDCFRYGMPQHEWVTDLSLVKLIKELKKLKTVKKIGLSHACLASALSNPDMVRGVSEELELSRENFTSVQVGIETAYMPALKSFMPLKAAPFNIEDWEDIVLKGWKLLCKNYIYPAATVMVGFSQDKDEIRQTLSLMKKIVKYHGMFFPLFVAPLGKLKENGFYYSDWDQMDKSLRELYLLSFKHMLNQFKDHHGLLFGTSPGQKIMNHLSILSLKILVCFMEETKDTIESNGLQKLFEMGKLALKESKDYFREQLTIKLHV
ncbi:MAG: B12-binding domain-containing radical SAM protein [Candidatus Helarchaeota archaeon]